MNKKDFLSSVEYLLKYHQKKNSPWHHYLFVRNEEKQYCLDLEKRIKEIGMNCIFNLKDDGRFQYYVYWN